MIDKIKKVVTVLDAFGNAVTQLNPDSTRHCRYFDVTFSKTGKVSGAIVWLFMLDKFRVTERPRSGHKLCEGVISQSQKQFTSLSLEAV